MVNLSRNPLFFLAGYGGVYLLRCIASIGLSEVVLSLQLTADAESSRGCAVCLAFASLPIGWVCVQMALPGRTFIHEVDPEGAGLLLY